VSHPLPPSDLARELAYLDGLAAAGRLADYLDAWGETGTPNVACLCVLANHLWRRLGVAVEVSYRRTGDPDRLEVLDEHATPLAALPPSLTTFVRRFDAGGFPDLIPEPRHDDPATRPHPEPAYGRPRPPAGG
jgi:hypothetical protein